MPYGWVGRVLHVDLTRRKTVKLPLNWEDIKLFIGGRGLNAITLFRNLKPGVDPLSPDNVLCFGTSPLTGTASPIGSGRFNVSAKSPLTGGFGDSNCGGFWSPELKYAGYDQIVIFGRAEKPVYIWIDDDEVEIRDAKQLWGLDNYETYNSILEEVDDPDIHIVSIGIAGEKLVRFANILSDAYRAAGRTGMGAVMGSKNLKAIAVRGTGGVKVANPEKLLELIPKYVEILYSDWFSKLFSEQGSMCLVRIYNDLGALVTRNFQEGYFQPIEELLGDFYVRKYEVKSRACFSCPLHCASYWKIKDGPLTGLSAPKIEFGIVMNYTTRLGIPNLEVGLKCIDLLNRYGLDSISTGAVIGFAMECYEKGILTSNNTEGLKLEWGNEEVVPEIVRKIAFREGLGDILAEGSKIAAEKIGRGAEKYAIHTKGLEHIECDPRGLQAFGLGYATSTRGADHLRALPAFEYTLSPEQAEKLFGTSKAADRFATEGKAAMVKWFEEVRAFTDAIEACKFITRTGLIWPEVQVEILNAVTGLHLTAQDALLIGERIVNVEKAFNVREGMTRHDDSLPERFLNEPLPSGPSKGHVCDLKIMLDEYYTLRGWDAKTGLPTRKKLEELTLVEIAEDLERLGKLPQ
jgi:aldehyde:ferredoxin oxidoreductase